MLADQSCENSQKDKQLLHHSYTGWPKSHFTHLKVNKSKPNRAKKIGYISNESPDLGVFLLMKTVLLFKYNMLQMLSIAVQAIHSTFHNLFRPFPN